MHETLVWFLGQKEPLDKGYWLPTPVFLGFPIGLDGEESACNAEDLGLIPGLGRSSGGGNGYPLQYSCLENPMGRVAWWATVHSVAEWDTTEQLSTAHIQFKMFKMGISLVIQWLRLHVPMQEAWVQSLVKELDPTYSH